MSAGGVVVGLDPVEGCFLEALKGRPGTGMDELLLVGREEGLSDGVVEARACSAQ